MSGVLYTVLTLDLTAAGRETVDGPWGVMRFLDAVDANDDIAATAKLTVRAERESEPSPLRLGQGFLARDTRRWLIEWEAQAGVIATIGFARRPEDVDWDADPPAKINSGAVKLAGSSVLQSGIDQAPNNSTSILVGSSDERRVIIKNGHPTLPLRISKDGAVNQGVVLGPAETIVLNTTANIYIRNDAAVAVPFSWLKERA